MYYCIPVTNKYTVPVIVLKPNPCGVYSVHKLISAPHVFLQLVMGESGPMITVITSLILYTAIEKSWWMETV